MPVRAVVRVVARRVVRVDRSPLNVQQWCLQLECGHEVWKTAKRKPTATKAACHRCPDRDEIAARYRK
jgi:hypothetical protein